MQKQPAVVIIARHGARLDQGDKEWHTTAEQPWDPPLSYGGWVQSQSLGARIAHELDNLDEDTPINGERKVGNPRPIKRRKITIHSSPYLRCVQTAIGIAAGLKHPSELTARRPSIAPLQQSALSKPAITPDNANASDPDIVEEDAIVSSKDEQPDRLDLKIDAFLGEWLSSGYFNKIKPPPSSSVLVSTAKDLLRMPPQEIKGADLAQTLYESLDLNDAIGEEDNMAVSPTARRAMKSLRGAFPKRSRTLSFGRDIAIDPVHDLRHHRRARSSTYSPPVPMYSIAPKDSIPIGFVAHARDACVNADYEWDSQLPPLCWGDGGQYEEEWSVMHRRFRDGLYCLLAYYSDTKNFTATCDADNDVEDEEQIVVLVTHQAGCNALIRLITSAPALYDVGTASLTMAVRKSSTERRASSPHSPISPRPRRGSLDLGLADEFDMKIIASTEHLRAGSNPLGLNSPSLGAHPAYASRRMAGPDSAEGFSIGDSLGWRSNSHQGVNRSSSLRSRPRDSASSIISASGSGLWGNSSRASSFGTDGSVEPRIGSTRKSTTSIIPEAEEAVIMDDTEDKATETVRNSTEPILKSSSLPVRSASQRTTASTGLWGGPPKTSNEGLWNANSARSSSGTFQRGSSPPVNGEKRPGPRRWTAAGS